MNIKIENFDVNYFDNLVDEDTRPVVLILHGWGCNINVYIHIIRALKDRYRVICVDMPGFGNTSVPKRAMNVDDYTDFIEKFILTLNLTKVNLIGHSFGGRIIIKLFSRKLHDVRFDKVVLIDAAGIKPAKKLSVTAKIKLFKLAKKLFEKTPLGKMYPNFIENWRKKTGSSDYNSTSGVMRDTLVKVVNEDLTDLLKNISSPTLLIWGEKDDATPISDAYKMNQLIPNSQLYVLEDAGHYSFLEHPKQVNDRILAFLNEEQR